MRTIDTDVLVIGGGAAGMQAAFSASEAGRSVALVYKNGGNCTSVAGGGFAAFVPGTEGDSAEIYYENTMKSSCGLADENLVRIFIERSAAALNLAISLGAACMTNENGSLKRFRSGGHVVPRTFRCAEGKIGIMLRTMAQRIVNAGVTLLSDYTIMQLLHDDTTVYGACGMDNEGKPLLIRAKSVVLATGGFAGIYKITTNPKAITGEGLEMAYEAGCTLKGLEFVQFLPTALVYPPEFAGKPISDPLRGAGAVLRNAALERFMPKYDPVNADIAGRDTVAAAIATEIAEGRGTPRGAVYIDARSLPPEKVLESCKGLGRYARNGLDATKVMLEVAPAAHFICGGIAIDETCATGVKGLFAAGEICATIHGANRLGGSALTETFIFGDIAGKSAAAFAGTTVAFRDVPNDTYSKLIRDSLTIPQNGKGPNVLHSEVKSLFWNALGVVRAEQPLAQAEKRFRDIADEVLREPYSKFSFGENLQRELLAKIAKLGSKVAKAARLRCESRGVHQRSDFRARSDNGAQHILFHKSAE